MLLRTPTLALSLIVALLAGCNGTGQSGSRPVASGASVDVVDEQILPVVHRSRPRAEPAVTAMPDDMDVYARIEFWPELLSSGARRAAPLNSGPFPLRLWEALKAKLAPTTTSIAVTVQPMYGETALPEIILFRLDYASGSGGGPTVTAISNGTIQTPWQRMTQGDRYAFVLRVRSLDQVNVGLVSLVETATSVLAGIGAGPTSGASAVLGVVTLPAAQILAGSVENILRTAFSGGRVESTPTLALGPRAQPPTGTANAFWRQDRLIIGAADGTEVVVVNANMTFRPTLSAPNVSDKVPSSADGRRPAPPLITRPLFPMDKRGPTAVASDWSLHGPLATLQARARQPNDPTAFESACTTAAAYLTNLGLTDDDALRMRFEVAQEGGFNLSDALIASNCFASERDRRVLRDMGYDPEVNRSRPRSSRVLSNADLDNLGRVMLGRSDAELDSAIRLFDRRVLVTAASQTLQAAEVISVPDEAEDGATVVVDQLRRRASAYGCFSQPGAAEGAPRRLDRSFLFQPTFPGAPPALLQLEGSADGSAVARVTVTRVTKESEIIARCSGSDTKTRETFLSALRSSRVVVTAER